MQHHPRSFYAIFIVLTLATQALVFAIAWGTEEEATEYGPQYYSQRGEDTPPRMNKNLGEYLTQDAEEFAYVYTQSEGWLCYDTCEWHDSYMEGVEIPSGALAV